MSTESLTDSTEDITAVLPAESTNDGANSAPANFGLIALYQVVMRTGWIFKTESIVMPAVLDVIAGPAWVRGCLPMLNRFGQSIPPFLASGVVRAVPRKKFALALTTTLMGLTFWGVAAIWLVTDGKRTWWMPLVFLLLYAVFFFSTGVNNLIVGTLSGKLIRFDHRGRLMLVANVVGVFSAVICAWVLLQQWLDKDSGNFFAIFGFAGSCFLASAVISLLLVEPADQYTNHAMGVRALFQSVASTFRDDREFRNLAILAMLFGTSMTLFPHYQALGRQRLGLGLDYLMPWVIAQNVGLSVLSVPAGWLADRFGNRMVIRLLMIVLCAAPLMALVLSRMGNFGGVNYFWVFFFVGAVPVTIRTIQNYCLELAPPADQPRYLASLSLAMAGPAVVTSALLGALLDVAGFEVVFLLVFSCLAWGYLYSRRLIEPRKRSPAL